MKISYDPAKRAKTLAERGLDFADAPSVFRSESVTLTDDRFDYGEQRYVTFGWLNAAAVAVVWTWRDDGRRVISMRRMHEEEIEDVGLARPR
jgi:uncharacterized protein